MNLHQLTPSLSSAHIGTTVHHEGLWTAILIMLSKAKLASVCVPWVSSKNNWLLALTVGASRALSVS